MSDKILLKKIFFLPIHSSRPKSKAHKLLDPKARKPLIFQGGIFMSLIINHNGLFVLGELQQGRGELGGIASVAQGVGRFHRAAV